MTATGINSDPPGSLPSAVVAPLPSSSLRSISLVTGLTFIQLLLQFAFQLVLANYFGAAGDMDSYIAALAPPIVIATILSGSLGYVLIPVVADRRANAGEQQAAAVAAQIGLYLFVVSLLLTVAVALDAPLLTTLLCPGFSPEQHHLTSQLLKISSILIVANSLIAYLNALLHCYQQFARPAIAGVVGTLITLAYVIALAPHQDIFAVAWAVVVGAGVTALLLAPFFLSVLWSSRARMLSPEPGTLRCLYLLTPLVLAAMVWRLDPLLDRFLASYLPAGSIAHMGYAWRLINGLSLIGTSGLSVVAFPAIAAHVAAGRRDSLHAELAHALRFSLFLVVPICVGLVAAAGPVVTLLFEHGQFTPADSRAVSALAALYVGVVLGVGLSDLLSRTFFALQEMLVPVAVSMLAFLMIAILKVFVAGPWGAAGLVAATSFYYFLTTAVLAAILIYRLSPDILSGVPGTLARSLAASLLAALLASFILRLSIPLVILPAAAASAITYLLSMWLLSDEFALHLIRRLTRPTTPLPPKPNGDAAAR